MPVLTAPVAPTHELGGNLFTSLATPSRGATDTAVWRVEIPPGTPATPHSLTREEVFVVLEGTAAVRIAGQAGVAGANNCCNQLLHVGFRRWKQADIHAVTEHRDALGNAKHLV